MKTFSLTISLCAILGISACQQPASPETEARTMLQKSRALLQDGNYNAARDTILSMRRKYPTAVQTRKSGILLLDSIEMFAAKDSCGSATGEEWKRLSLKAQFYERKLQEDLNKLNI